MTAITVTPLATYRNEKPYPFCPGCGHAPVLDRLNDALVQLAIDHEDVVIVSDIGCSGLSDQYFTTSAFHGLHGRSVTYATGIKLANPELTVIVIMGDGGTGIGGTHLLSAARRNIGVTVIVMNNLNFGMTGGQHSTTTPEGGITPTTPGGNLEHPLDICATVGVNGAGYVYRGTSFDKDLADRMATAIAKPGFALLDIWDLCTAYYVRSNKFTRANMVDSMHTVGMDEGLLYERAVPEYSAAYREIHTSDRGMPVGGPRPIATEQGHSLDEPLQLVVAGSAGGRIRSAARIVAEAAIRSGLWVTQRDDFPITVKAGHSVSQVVISPEEMPLTTITEPDVLVILSSDGFAKAGPYLDRMSSDGIVFTIPEYRDVVTAATVEVIDPKAAPKRIPKTSLGLVFLAAVVERLQPFPTAVLRETAAAGRFADVNLESIDTGIALLLD